MGFSISWCAVKEESADALFAQLGLSPTGEIEEFPESLVSSAKLDTGWRVLWYNSYACPFLEPEKLRDISTDFDLVVLRVEEHVMASSSELWSAGQRKWWISHEGEDGPKGISFDGTLPGNFSTTRAEMEAAQLAEGGDSADVDYIFEIPLLVAQSIVGFKHDENCPHLLDGGFAVLSGPKRSKGLFQRLFDRS